MDNENGDVVNREEMDRRFNTALSMAQVIAESLQTEYGISPGPANRIVRLIFFGTMAEKLIEGLARGEVDPARINEDFTEINIHNLLNMPVSETVEEE